MLQPASVMYSHATSQRVTGMQGVFITPHELTKRWNGAVSTGTLANWRSKRTGPPFTKLGGRVLYPLKQLQAWEEAAMRLDVAANDNAPS